MRDDRFRNRAGSEERDGGFRAVIRSFQRLNTNLFGHSAEQIYADRNLMWNADQDECAAQAGNSKPRVDCFSPARRIDR